MEKIAFTTIDEIKPHLRHGDIVLIAQMLKSKYSLRTVTAQLCGQRTLKQPVIDAANKLIQSRQDLIDTFTIK